MGIEERATRYGSVHFSSHPSSFSSASMKLSVCIPTYNFGAFIGGTLESIVEQLEPGVEVVVFDGGSTDDTGAVVGRFSARNPAVRYVRQAFRGGIDRDMARSVDLALGEYCWLFSSDDIMKPGAIRRVLQETAGGLDVYLGGVTLCDNKMAPIEEHPVLDAPWGTVFNLQDAAQRLRYFGCARTTMAFFSFMGAIVIRRGRWQAVPLDEAYVGSCWAHVVRILRMIPDGLTVRYVGESLQQKRSDNDSFLDKGLVYRYAIAIDGYHRIAADVFGEDSPEARHIRRVIVNEYRPKHFFFAKRDCIRKGRPTDIAELDRLAERAYRDRSLRTFVYLATYRLLPLWVYESFRAAVKRLRRTGPRM
jgi:abequosyltransferase